MEGRKEGEGGRWVGWRVGTGLRATRVDVQLCAAVLLLLFCFLLPDWLVHLGVNQFSSSGLSTLWPVGQEKKLLSLSLFFFTLTASRGLSC